MSREKDNTLQIDLLIHVSHLLLMHQEVMTDEVMIIL